MTSAVEWDRFPVIISFAEAKQMVETYGFAGSQGQTVLEGQRLVPRETPSDIPESWKRHYLDRMTDLIDKYQPDLFYTDGHLPFQEHGLKMVAHLYNQSAQLHAGVTEAVYNSKLDSDCDLGTCVLDRERGVSEGIAPNPWQTDTCIGDWHYKRG